MNDISHTLVYPGIMFIALDLETTGLQARKDKIIEFAAMKIQQDGTILEKLHFVINPGVPIPQIITHITGITNEEVTGKPTLEELKPQIIEFIGNFPILGHSIQFDIDFLNANGIAENAIPLDTFQLAQTLLPKESSYSLEILSEKYHLPHPNKHRADDDTRVAIELYKMLIQKIREIPENHLDPIRNLLTKSTWTWKNTFLQFLGESPAPAPTHTTITQDLPSPGSDQLREQLFENLTTGHSMLIECPDATPLDLALAATHMAEQTGEHVVIVTPHPQRIPQDINTAHLEHPGRYFNQKYFEKFITQSIVTDPETRLAIKVILWRDHTSTGLKEELSIGDEEQSAWAEISEMQNMFTTDNPDPESFYGKAFKNAKYTSVLVVHPGVLLQNIVRKATLLPEKAHLIIDEIDSFEDETLHHLTNTFSLDQFNNGLSDELKNSFAILFGILGILLEKSTQDDPGDQPLNYQQLTLEPHHISGPQGTQIKGLLENIEEKINQATPFIQNQFIALKKVLAQSPDILAWISINHREDVLLKACHKDPASLLPIKVWNQFQTINGISNIGMLNGTFKFIKNRIHLPENMEEMQLINPNESPPIPIFFYTNLPNVKVPANNIETEKTIQKILQTQKGNESVFLLTNSIKAAEQLHEKIAHSLQETEWNIFTQGISGGLGKITQRFENNPIQTLIIGTEWLFDRLLNSPESHHIQTLLLHRIPFKFPGHPVLKNECDQMENNFIEYGVPIATLALKKILHEFKTHATPQEIHILDPRIENYDKVFLCAFNAPFKF